MATFPRGVPVLERTLKPRCDRVVAEAEPEPVGKLPGDKKALRGIPVVGVKGGAGGAIYGTRPDRMNLRPGQ